MYLYVWISFIYTFYKRKRNILVVKTKDLWSLFTVIVHLLDDNSCTILEYCKQTIMPLAKNYKPV